MKAELVVVCGTVPAHADLVGLPGITSGMWPGQATHVLQAADAVRVQAAFALPTATHEALARMQQVFGAPRCTLATTGIDGMLLKAGAEDVIELRGSLFRLCCSDDAGHPRVPVSGPVAPEGRCERCGAQLRPDLALPGERHRQWEELLAAIGTAKRGLWIDVDEAMATALSRAARQVPSLVTYAVGPHARMADEPLRGTADDVIPALVERWIG